jgi:hypothetical protein
MKELEKCFNPLFVDVNALSCFPKFQNNSIFELPCQNEGSDHNVNPCCSSKMQLFAIRWPSDALLGIKLDIKNQKSR